MADHLDNIIDQLNALRARAHVLLTKQLVDAAFEIAKRHLGCRVVACSAMGSWSATVYDVPWVFEDGSKGVHDVHYSSRDGDEPHAVFEAFDRAWDELKTYPTLRITISTDGNQSVEKDW